MEATNNLNFLATLLPFSIVIFIIAVGVVLLNQHFQKNLYLQKLTEKKLKIQHQNELLRSSINTQEEERKRIAQDLHDELGSVLSIMRMHLILLEEQSSQNSNNIPSVVQTVRKLSETAMTSVRSISHQLMPPQLENFGLVRTLEAVINQGHNIGSLDIRLSAPDNFPQLSWHTSLGLYRIVMELISNTIRHADASIVDIQFEYHNQLLICKYEDNGKGLIKLNTQQGLGLNNIEGRVSSLNGSIGLTGSREDAGFRALIQIPLLNSL